MVIGVSPDPANLQAKFKEKEDLPFILLADENHEVAEKYGVWIEKKLYGRTYWGNERTSFLIDAEGRIVTINRTECELLGYAPQEMLGRSVSARWASSPTGCSAALAAPAANSNDAQSRLAVRRAAPLKRCSVMGTILLS